PGAVEVVLQGADAGAITQEPKTPGVIHYARSLPRAEALRPDVLLAHRMNGEPLRPEHGAPVRALVPGWYGMASVKWLTRVVVRPAVPGILPDLRLHPLGTFRRPPNPRPARR